MIYIVHTIEVILTFSIILLLSTGMVFIFIFAEEWKENRRIKRYERNYIEAKEKCLQYKCRQELRKKEREKYPLFYWRELIEEKLEDGNF